MHRPRLTRPLALAGAIGTLAIAAGAPPATAAPFDPVVITAGDTRLGSPANPAVLDWNHVGANSTPVLAGQLGLLNSAGVQAEVRIQRYDDAINHNPLGAPSSSGVFVGAGGPFNAMVGFASPAGPSRHLHVELLDDRATPGTLQIVGVSFENA